MFFCLVQQFAALFHSSFIPLIADFSSLCAVQFSSVHSLTLGPFQFSHLLLLLLCTIGHNQLGGFFCTPNEMARLLLCLLLFPSLSVAFSVKLSELVNVMHANVSPDDDDDDGEGKTRGKASQSASAIADQKKTEESISFHNRCSLRAVSPSLLPIYLVLFLLVHINSLFLLPFCSVSVFSLVVCCYLFWFSSFLFFLFLCVPFPPPFSQQQNA